MGYTRRSFFIAAPVVWRLELTSASPSLPVHQSQSVSSRAQDSSFRLAFHWLFLWELLKWSELNWKTKGQILYNVDITLYFANILHRHSTDWDNKSLNLTQDLRSSGGKEGNRNQSIVWYFAVTVWWESRYHPNYASMCREQCSNIYTVSGKNGPPKHVQITLWIENDSHYFSLYHAKPSICNVYVKFHDNQSVHCWDIAFYKKDGRKLSLPTLPINACA